MIKIENTDVWGFKHAIRGARNPMNSWAKSDTVFGLDGRMVIGENDLKLMKNLIKAGSDERKFMRQIFVSVDITASLYWWKQYDCYKVGTVANSTSSMHKIHSQAFELNQFSCDKLSEKSLEKFESYMAYLEELRLNYVETKDKAVWYELIQMLPANYNQKRTCTLNYENLINMYHARKNHKLDEWHTFCDWIETLPYAKELIVGEKRKLEEFEKLKSMLGDFENEKI